MTMTDEMINTTQQTAKSFSLGPRLKAAREALQLSEKEAAARLHLSPKYIAVMENEDFKHNLPATFIRGYLRSYAKLLNLSEFDINQAIEQLGIPSSVHTPATSILQAQPVNRSDRYVRWITYLVLMILVGLVAMWWHSHSRYIVSDMANHAAATQPEKTTTLSVNDTESATSTIQSTLPDIETPIPTAIVATPTQPPLLQQPQPATPEINIQPPSLATSDASELNKKPLDLAHMKMEAPEPGLDTSDDGRDDDDDGYSN